MIFFLADDYKYMSRIAANYLSAQVILKPGSVIGLATGETPIGTYNQHETWYKKGDIDFSQTKTVNLDEYKGLGGSDPQSYRYFMNANLFHIVNIPYEHTYIPDGTESDSIKACDDYNRLLSETGSADIQVLGLGHDGHIGFNEPAEDFPKFTHCVDLTESTIEANKRFFASEDDVPRQAYTMGIKNIMQAKKILDVVSGEDKADILKEVLYGAITPQVPASILQLHNDVTIVADEAALSKIK